MRHVKHIILILTLFIINPAKATGPSNPDVKEFVNNTSKKVIALLQSSISDQQKSDGLRKLFVDVMDIDWMGRFVVARYWNSLDNGEKDSYLATYREYLISSYVPLFKKYHNQSMVMKGVKNLDNDQYIVTTEIRGDPQKAPYLVEYRVKLMDNVFKVRDIIAEGVSMLTTQRADFGSILAEGGIEALKRKLEEKTKQ